MSVEFWKLSYPEIASILRKIDPVLEIEMLEEVVIAEANVFLCKYKSKRFNIYFDLDYGPGLKAVDKMDEEVLKMIEKLIAAEI